MKLAYFSPLNPVQSGISDYSEDLLPYLARYAGLDLFVDKVQPTNPKITQMFACYSASKYSAKAQAEHYDAALLHLGNSAAHTQIYQLLQKPPASPPQILVLHDLVLHHFLIGYYLNRGKAQDYIRLMAQNYGSEGERVAREVIRGKLPHVLFDYPLNASAIEAAAAVIVHSRYAANLLSQKHPHKQIGVVRMGVPLLPQVSQIEARQRLGLPADEFIVVSLGHLNPYKRLDSALWAFKSFNREFPASRYLLVGSLSPNYDVKAMIRALGLENKVTVVGFASDSTYNDYLYASDVCINLRYPTAGETSASLLRIMGAGRPVLVSRTGSFEELPEDTCIKVDVDEAEEELLLEYLRLLRRDETLRLQLGQHARNYVATNARLEDAAYDYYAFISKVLEQPTTVSRPTFSFTPAAAQAVKPASTPIQLEAVKTVTPPDAGLLGEVAQAALEIGLSENATAMSEIATAINFVSNVVKKPFKTT